MSPDDVHHEIVLPSTDWMPPAPKQEAMTSAFESFVPVLKRNILDLSQGMIIQKAAPYIEPEGVALYVVNRNDPDESPIFDITADVSVKAEKIDFEGPVDPSDVIKATFADLDPIDRNILGVGILRAFVDYFREIMYKWATQQIDDGECIMHIQAHPLSFDATCQSLHDLYLRIRSNNL